LKIAPHPCQTCLPSPGRVNGQPCPACYGTALGPQGAFLASTADYLLYGGQAGGGKTFSLVLKAAAWFLHPRFSAVLFRQTRREVMRSIWKEARFLLPKVDPGVQFNKQDLLATSSTGATIEFAFAEEPEQIERFQSAQYNLVGFDEGTHTQIEVIRFMFTRIRSPDPALPRQLCVCTNPGGESHDDIFRDFAPWLDPGFKGPGGPAKAWEKRHYLTEHDDQGAARSVWVPASTPGAKTANFIPARYEDNPTLRDADPHYKESLKARDLVTYERQAHGNWLIKEAAGTMFQKSWFKVLVTADGALRPDLVRTRIRVWDRAHTEGKGDYTVGARWVLARDGWLCVEDVVRAQLAPGRAEELLWKTAAKDPPGTIQWYPDDPGAGVAYADTILREAAKRSVRIRIFPVSNRGDKAGRARLPSAKAWHGQVFLAAGQWNDVWLDEHTAFPDQCENDDQVDTSSDACWLLDDFKAHGRFTVGRDRPR
jgi:predicted phage terminase large subunit-like protein